MKKGAFLTTLLRSNRTIFSTLDIAMLWQEESSSKTRVRLHYYVKQGSLIQLRRGLYAKNTEYNKFELATKIFTPSYLSFETILAREGIIFQYSTDITVASYLSRGATVGDQNYLYKKMKDSVLMNPAGIIQEEYASIATKERAVLDTLYSNREYHFDNTRSLDWNEVFCLLPLYSNKRLEKKVKEIAP